MPNWGALREPVQGICLHYDASASDAGAVEWLTKDPRCKVSYHALVLDDGRVVQVAPWGTRSWAQGVCRPSDPARLLYRDANSTFESISAAARDGDTITPPQYGTILRLVVERFQAHAWPLVETWRLTSHHLEAWPRGRKHDVIGSNPVHPVIDLVRLRRWLEEAR